MPIVEFWISIPHYRNVDECLLKLRSVGSGALESTGETRIEPVLVSMMYEMVCKLMENSGGYTPPRVR